MDGRKEKKGGWVGGKEGGREEDGKMFWGIDFLGWFKLIKC